MAEREKGVASVACPNCDKELALSDQPDGSLAAESCSKCYPAPTKKQLRETEKAFADSEPRERGTTVTQKENSDG